jgi:hypothetical protein
MQIVNLVQVQHSVKIGDTCGDIEPNITEDTLFIENGVPVGFYIRSISGKLKQYVEIANAELLSERVPKSEMKRSSGLLNKEKEVLQFSTIIGAIPPKPHMRRNYPAMSSVHQVKTARNFIKAMLLACKEAEGVILELTPEIYHRQKKIIAENCPEKFRFGNLFTSSISNFNIAAAFHRDGGNLEGCVNVIIAKKRNATGGNTTVPDYGATVDSCDNSMLVYPAWKNVHGVTPIRPTTDGGYRNSLVFYPLKAFAKYV